MATILYKEVETKVLLFPMKIVPPIPPLIVHRFYLSSKWTESPELYIKMTTVHISNVDQYF